MKKHVLLAVGLTWLAGCAAPSTRSAYPSGWSLASSLEKQRQCGIVWIDKAQFMGLNLQLLVTNGYLSADQAARARAQEVRVGDPECLAYAAFGLAQALVTETFDTRKRLTAIAIDFRCENSPVSCPGWRVAVADGQVTAVTRLPRRGELQTGLLPGG